METEGEVGSIPVLASCHYRFAKINWPSLSASASSSVRGSVDIKPELASLAEGHTSSTNSYSRPALVTGPRRSPLFPCLCSIRILPCSRRARHGAVLGWVLGHVFHFTFTPAPCPADPVPHIPISSVTFQEA